jgi:hypothetical protein
MRRIEIAAAVRLELTRPVGQASCAVQEAEPTRLIAREFVAGAARKHELGSRGV